MTAAQKDYFAKHRIDPWSLTWRDAALFGLPEWGHTEAALLPDGRILVANGSVMAASSLLGEPGEETP